jgi:hypothetical protein
VSYRHLLDAVDAALHRLADDGSEPFWAPAGTRDDAVPKTNSLTPQSFGQFGHLGHRKAVSSSATANSVTGGTVPPSRRVLFSGDQSAQTAQKAETAHKSVPYAWAPGWTADHVGAQSAQGVRQQPQTERARPSGHDLLTRWLAAHPPPACPRDRCPRCQGAIDANSPEALPVLRASDPPGPIRLHVGCYGAWQQARLRQARRAVRHSAAAGGDGP